MIKMILKELVLYEKYEENKTTRKDYEGEEYESTSSNEWKLMYVEEKWSDKIQKTLAINLDWQGCCDCGTDYSDFPVKDKEEAIQILEQAIKKLKGDKT